MSDYILYNGELYHYGVKGMKWGVRKSQNKNGSLIKADKKRQDKGRADKQRKERSEKIRKTVHKGVEKTAQVMTKVGSAYLTDQLFFGGAGTRAAKAAVKTIGRAAITAVTMARGGYDIKWYD